MSKALRFLLYGENRLIDKLDKKKKEESIRRGTKKYGKIIRNENGTIRRVVVG